MNNVFIKIVDVWGFITVYFPLLELLHNGFKNNALVGIEINIYKNLKDILMKYLYTPRITEININDLAKDLKKIHVCNKNNDIL